MKKLVSKIITTAMIASTIVLPHTAHAAVTVDEALKNWGFTAYQGSNGLNAVCSIVDSGEADHGEVLQIYSTNNPDRNNRYGGIQYELDLQPGTYRIFADFKCVEQLGTDIGRQRFISLATSTHGASWGDMVSNPSPSTEWGHKNYKITVKSAGKYKVQFGMAGNCIMYFDNIRVCNESNKGTDENFLPTGDFSTKVVEADKLPAPENLSISSKNYGDATLTWSAVENASSYKVFKSVDGGTMKEVAAVSGTSATVKNTSGNITYSVQAIGDGVNYADSDYATLSFKEELSEAGLPDGYTAIKSNASGDIIFSYDVVEEDGDNVLKMTQHSSGANGSDWGGIRAMVDPVKLIPGHTYYFGFNYKKDSLNDEEYTKILVGLGNSKGNRTEVQASKGDALEWKWWSRNNVLCTNVNDFGIDIIVNRNASGYINNIICYDMADPNKTNLIENAGFEQMEGVQAPEAENVRLIQGVSEVTVKWDYPASTMWAGAEIWNVTEDFEMSDEANKVATIEKSSDVAQRMNVPVVFGEITTYKLVLVDKFGNKSNGTKLIVSGMDDSQNSYNFAQLDGWNVAGETANENAPMAIRIDKSYNTESDGALYVAQSRSSDANNNVTIQQKVSAEPSTTYVLSYDIKGKGAASIWRTQMFFAADPWNSNKVVAFANVAKPYWQTKTMEYTTSETETSLAINMTFRSACELWFDNFKVYKKDDAEQKNILTNGTFTATAAAQNVENATCLLVDDEFTYLAYTMPENSGADRVLLESADGKELYAVIGANVIENGEIDLNTLFIDTEMPEKIKLTVCDVYGNKSSGVIVNTVPVLEMGDVVIADGKATMSVVNQTEDTLPLVMVAAAYDTEGNLLNVKVSEQYNFEKQEMGDEAYTAEVVLPDASENVKVMVFNSLSDLKPYTKAIVR